MYGKAVKIRHCPATVRGVVRRKRSLCNSGKSAFKVWRATSQETGFASRNVCVFEGERLMRNHFYLYLPLVAVLAFGQSPSNSSATRGSVHGVVTDPQHRVVPGAGVSLYLRTTTVPRATVTNESGAYGFDDLEPGDYLIEASAAGFARFPASGLHVAAGEQTRDIALTLAAQGEQVMVTASGTPLTTDEISKAVSTVDESEIAERDQFSLAEALRFTPGLRVQQLGGTGGLTTIKIRGLRNEDTAVLFDGLRFRDVTTPQGDASSFIQDFIDTDIDRMEILRGTGSSLYGTDAIGGVVNLISNQGGGVTHGSLLLEGGQLGTFRGKGDVAGGALDNRVEYSAGLTHLNVTEGVGGNDPARITSGQGHASYHLTPGLVLTARLYAADSYSRQLGDPGAVGALSQNGILGAIPAEPAQVALYASGVPLSSLALGSANYLPAIPDPDSARAGRFTAGALTLTGTISPSATYSLSYQGVSTHANFSNGPAGVGYQPVGGNTAQINDGLDQIASAKLSWQVSPNNLIDGGYEFEQENYSSRALQPGNLGNSSVDASEGSHSFWLQDQARFFDGRLLVAASGRTQIFNLGVPSFSPQASAPYAGTQVVSPPNAYTGDGSVAWFFRSTGTKIRGHAGRGYRAPSLYERFGSYFDPIYGYSVYGDPRLTPEHSTAFDGGIDQSLWNNRIRASVTYFYTRIDNEIFFDDYTGLINPATDPYGRSAGYYNSLGGLARGVEVSTSVAATASLDLNAAYTYTNSQQRAPVILDIFRTFEVPDNQFSFVATQRIGSRFFVNFNLAASSSYLAPVYSLATFSSLPFRFPGMHDAGLGASYRWPIAEHRDVRFFGRITNLFNQNYFEAGFPTAGIGAYGGMQFEF